MSNFWLPVVTLKNAKRLKKDKRRINADNLASQKTVEFSSIVNQLMKTISNHFIYFFTKRF